MIYNLAEDPDVALPEYDLCIVGGGLMGLLLANELKDSGKRIAVLESGGVAGKNQWAERAKQVVTTGLPIRVSSRERGLGGSTLTWGGLTGVFDSGDLTLPGQTVSVWPISYETLLDYAAKAANQYSFPDFSTFNHYAEGPLVDTDSVLQSEIFAAVEPPVRFNEKFKHIFAGEAVDLLSGCTITQIVTSVADATLVESVRGFITPDQSFSLIAKTFVVASGGIENARLLLHSKQDNHPAGLGNQHDQVGRYFMNHPKGVQGKIEIKDVRQLEPYFVKRTQGIQRYPGLGIKPTIRRERNVPHAYVQLIPQFPWSTHRGFSAVMALRNRLRGVKNAGTNLNELTPQTSRWEKVPGLIYLSGLYLLGYYWLCKRNLLKPKLTAVHLRNYHEMVPRPENRVVLAAETDDFGVPLAQVEADLTTLEKQALITLHEEIDTACQAAGAGRVTSPLSLSGEWPVTMDAAHHMGATRMGTDPTTSVVDADLRIHGIVNAYVVGTSVLPTGGNINPTLMAAALAVRLSEHLKQTLCETR